MLTCVSLDCGDNRRCRHSDVSEDIFWATEDVGVGILQCGHVKTFSLEQCLQWRLDDLLRRCHFGQGGRLALCLGVIPKIFVHPFVDYILLFFLGLCD